MSKVEQKKFRIVGECEICHDKKVPIAKEFDSEGGFIYCCKDCWDEEEEADGFTDSDDYTSESEYGSEEEEEEEEENVCEACTLPEESQCQCPRCDSCGNISFEDCPLVRIKKGGELEKKFPQAELICTDCIKA